MFNSIGLIFGQVLTTDVGDPSDLIPDGPNFGAFSGLGDVIQLIIGILLVVVFVVGLFVGINGLRQFRLGNRDTGQGAKGVGKMISGGIMIVASFLAIPIINLVITIAKGFGSQIN